MARVRIELNRQGVAGYLRGGGGVAEVLQERAAAIASAAGDGMETDYSVHSARARASVRTATAAARRAEAENRALTRAVGGAAQGSGRA